jgi:hypothetical protein
VTNDRIIGNPLPPGLLKLLEDSPLAYDRVFVKTLDSLPRGEAVFGGVTLVECPYMEPGSVVFVRDEPPMTTWSLPPSPRGETFRGIALRVELAERRLRWETYFLRQRLHQVYLGADYAETRRPRRFGKADQRRERVRASLCARRLRRRKPPWPEVSPHDDAVDALSYALRSLL